MAKQLLPLLLSAATILLLQYYQPMMVTAFTSGGGGPKKLANRPQKVEGIDANRCIDKSQTPATHFASSAFNCPNEAGDEECAELFGIKTDPNLSPGAGGTPALPPPLHPGGVIRDPKAKYSPAERNGLCNSPFFQEAVKKCRAQCFTCCEMPQYKCDDEVFTKSFTVPLPMGVTPPTPNTAMAVGPFKCSEQRDTTCLIPEFRELMIYACPQSCGLCDVRDARDRGKKASEAEAQLQAAKEKARQMQGQQRTKPPQMPRPRPRKANCRDNPDKKKGWCYHRLHKCEDEAMWVNVQKHCPETCGECLPTNFRCKDLDARLCKQWNTKTASRPVPFCENNDYPLSAKLLHCASTCGICPD